MTQFAMTARAWTGLRNMVSYKSSSRIWPLKLSIKAFWVGLPGAMLCQSTLCAAHQSRIAFEVSSVPSPLSLGPMAQQWQLADDHNGLAAPFDQRRQFPSHAATRNRCVRYCSKAFPRDVIDHVQHPEPPPTAELVMREPKVRAAKSRARGRWLGPRSRWVLGCQWPCGALCVYGRLTLLRCRADRCG